MPLLLVRNDITRMTVAFPLISSGVYGYPKAEAFRVATETIAAFLDDHDLTVYLVLFDKGVCSLAASWKADTKLRLKEDILPVLFRPAFGSLRSTMLPGIASLRSPLAERKSPRQSCLLLIRV